MSPKKLRYMYFSDDHIAQYALTQSFLAEEPELDFFAAHAHLISQFLYFAQREDPKIQIAGLQGLEHFACGLSVLTQQVLECGSLPVLGNLIKTSTNSKIKEMALRVLGNIAKDSIPCRDAVLNSKARTIIKDLSVPLLEALANGHWQDQIDLFRGFAYALCQLSGGKPSPLMSHLKPFLPVLSKFLFICNGDESILTDTLLAFSYLTDGPNDLIQRVLDCEILPKLVEFIENGSMRDKDTFIQPMIRLLANIATGNDAQTQTLIDSGALASIVRWINHPLQEIRKDTIWLFSNLAAGQQTQIQAVIDLGVIPQLLEMVQDESQKKEILMEILWVVAILLDLGVVKAMSTPRLFLEGPVRDFIPVIDLFKNLIEKSKELNRLEQVKDSMTQANLLERFSALGSDSKLIRILNKIQQTKLKEILDLLAT